MKLIESTKQMTFNKLHTFICLVESNNLIQNKNDVFKISEEYFYSDDMKNSIFKHIKNDQGFY